MNDRNPNPQPCILQFLGDLRLSVVRVRSFGFKGLGL